MQKINNFQVVPAGDPTLQIEWYHNGVPLQLGNRFKQTFDFGFIALDIAHAYPEDTGQYVCRVVSATGETTSSATLSVEGMLIK